MEEKHEIPPRAGLSSRLLFRLHVLLVFLVPSFIQHRIWPSTYKAPRIHPTSYLDGLRGVASLIVFFCHYTEHSLGWFTGQPYGSWDDNETVKASSILQLPYLRLIYSGRPMVHIFFFISGFALSYKPLTMLRKRDLVGTAAALSSSVFRRAVRLFLPTTVSSFVAMLLVHYGWGNLSLVKETMWEQVSDWCTVWLWEITNSWDWETQKWPRYDVHLWTIPIEFAHSMLLFVTLLGLARCKIWVRLFSVVGIMLYCLRLGRWAAFEFIGGMLLCEIYLIEDLRNSRLHPDKEAPAVSTGGPKTLSGKITQAFWVSILIISLYIAGWPNEHPERAPLLGWLHDHTPEPYFSQGYNQIQFFWFMLGGLAIMLSTMHLPRLQKLLTTPFVRYLANISYALYIVHGPIMDAILPTTRDYMWYLTGGGEASWRRTIAWPLGLLLLAPSVIWGADVFWRAVDLKSVDAGRWIEDACLRKDD